MWDPARECQRSPVLGLGDDGTPSLPWSPLSSAGPPHFPGTGSQGEGKSLRFAGDEAQTPILLFCDDLVAKGCDERSPDTAKVQTGVWEGVEVGTDPCVFFC